MCYFFTAVPRLRKTKKKIEKGVIATATAAIVLVAGSFDSPQDLINDPRYKPKTVIEKMASEEDDRRKLKQKTLLKEKLRELIYRIPVKISTPRDFVISTFLD